jgi:ferredoxin--NADP+ reductase
VRLFYGGRTGLDLAYANDEETNLSDYYDQPSFKAFKSLAANSLMSSSEALQRGLRENLDEVWDLIRASNTYVFLAGLGKIAQVFDRVMAELAGSPEAWQTLREAMIQQSRWSELIY